MAEAADTKAGERWGRRWLGFVAGVLAGLVGGYLWQAYRSGTGVFEGNAARDAVLAGAAQARGRAWARPMQLEGVPNLHQVSEGLYRGAQPTREGMVNLKRLRIKTVVNLRAEHSDRDDLAGTGLAYEHINCKAWRPEDEDVARFLEVVGDPNRRPVFVHCQHGADRTGTMCAAYRIVVEGWSKEEAIAEMTRGGFGYHLQWFMLVNYLRRLDVARLRQEAGLDATSGGGG